MKNRKKRASHKEWGTIRKPRSAIWRSNEPLGTDYSSASLYRAMMHDRKRKGSGKNIIVKKSAHVKPRKEGTPQWDESRRSMLRSNYERLAIRNKLSPAIQTKMEERGIQAKKIRAEIKKIKEKALEENWTYNEYIKNIQPYEDRLKRNQWGIELLKKKKTSPN